MNKKISEYTVTCIAWSVGLLMSIALTFFMVFAGKINAALPFVLFTGVFLGALPLSNRQKQLETERRIQQLESDLKAQAKFHADLTTEWSLRVFAAEHRLEDHQQDAALINWLETHVEPPEGNSWREYLTEKIKTTD